MTYSPYTDTPPTCECGNTEDLLELDGEHFCLSCIITFEYPEEPWSTDEHD